MNNEHEFLGRVAIYSDTVCTPADKEVFSLPLQGLPPADLEEQIVRQAVRLCQTMSRPMVAFEYWVSPLHKATVAVGARRDVRGAARGIAERVHAAYHEHVLDLIEGPDRDA